MLVPTAANGYTGATLVSGGTLQVGSGGSGASIGSTSGVLDNGSLVFKHADSVTFSPLISGSGSLTQAGPGALTLPAGNTYGGKTYVNGSVLSVYADNSLGTPPSSAVSDQITLNGGELNFRANFGISPNRGITLGPSGGTLQAWQNIQATINSVITGSGPLTLNSYENGSFVSLASPANSYSGGTTFNQRNNAPATLYVSKLADGGQNSSIGALSSAAANFIITTDIPNGQTVYAVVQYTGGGDSTNRLFTIGNGEPSCSRQRGDFQLRQRPFELHQQRRNCLHRRPGP